MKENANIAGYNAEATALTGVSPTNTIQFGVCTSGRKSADTAETITTTIVKDAESLSISIDNGIEEWNPMDQGGWVRRLMTSKSLSSVTMVIREMIILQVLQLRTDRIVIRGYQLYFLILTSL